MMTLEELLTSPQYSLPQPRKECILLEHLNALTKLHRARCPEYRKITDILFAGGEARALADVPYLPVGLFKTRTLSSIDERDIFRTLTSSGTTGQQVSRIVLDRSTAMLQANALSRIMMHILGRERLPMIIVDSRAVLKDRTQPSARAAGVLGMMNFGRHHFWALNENFELDEEGLDCFLRQFGHEPFLIFGFTYLVWSKLRSLGRDLSQGILVHSGGWKKLQEQAVSNEEFKRAFRASTGLHRVYNFYGMAEQAGSVFLEGDDGCLYPPNFADVIVRDPETWQEAATGTAGILQVLSLLPHSYPGHSILTEDIGLVESIDSAAAGRCGKAFRVLGRMPKAELRGCSDTHTERAA